MRTAKQIGDMLAITGMTYREHLISQALAGICANNNPYAFKDFKTVDEFSIRVADQVLERLAKEESDE